MASLVAHVFSPRCHDVMFADGIEEQLLLDDGPLP